MVSPQINFPENYSRRLEAESTRITIHLSSDTLIKLKSMAVKEGLPYQTMIQSLLHKIVTEQYIPRILLEDRDRKLAKIEKELQGKDARASWFGDVCLSDPKARLGSVVGLGG